MDMSSVSMEAPRSPLTLSPRPARSSADPPPPADQPDTRTDEDLLLSYRAHQDAESFEELIRRYKKPLYGLLRSRVGDPFIVRDLLQETFLQVHLSCGPREPARARAWLYVIAIRVAANWYRKNGHARAISLSSGASGYVDSVAIDDLPPDRIAQAAEQRAELHRAISSLPEKYQQPVILRYLHALKFREIAEALCVAEITVRRRLRRAVERLNGALASQGLQPTYESARMLATRKGSPTWWYRSPWRPKAKPRPTATTTT